MAREETNVSNRVMLDQSPQGTVLWKNVRGLFYTLDKKRKVLAGILFPGASDLVGYTKVVITPEMVGKTVAVITVFESKTATGGNGSTEQKDFMGGIRNAGGIAGIVRTPEDAREIKKNWRPV